ncbi:MAG: hypothetical protein CMH55_07090 [Myxococcales bacterium]|nr:hypothetical protein [Myxococcales bacterium]
MVRCFGLAVLLFSSVSGAARVELSLDPNPVQAGARTTLEIKVHHQQGGPVSAEELRLGAFTNLGSAGRFNSTRWTISGGRKEVMQQTVLRYQLRAPDKPGKRRIGPVDVIADGRRWRGPAVTVNVRSLDSLAEQPEGEPLFLHLEVSPRDPVVGQQFTVSAFLYHLYRQVEVHKYSEVSHPEGKDLWWEELSLPKGGRAMVEEVGGQRYVRRLIGRWAGFAEASGPMELGGSRAVVEVIKEDGFFRRSEAVELRSASLSLQVNALPEDITRQEVGRYEVEAELDPPDLMVGDAAQLSIKVTGAGDLAAFPMTVPPLPKGLRAFNAQRQVDLWRESEFVGGTLSWTLSVQATRPGRFTIDAFVVRWFDPELGQIKEEILGPFELQAKGSEPNAAGDARDRIGPRANVRPMGPIGGLRDQVGAPVWARGPILPICAALLALLSLVPRRSQPTVREVVTPLNRLEQALQNLAGGEAVRGLTRQELLAHLDQRLSGEELERLDEALSELDRLTYGGQTTAQEEAEALLASWLEGLR